MIVCWCEPVRCCYLIVCASQRSFDTGLARDAMLSKNPDAMTERARSLQTLEQMAQAAVVNGACALRLQYHHRVPKLGRIKKMFRERLAQPRVWGKGDVGAEHCEAGELAGVTRARHSRFLSAFT